MTKQVVFTIAFYFLIVAGCQQGNEVDATTTNAQADLAPRDTRDNREMLIGTWYSSHSRSDGSIFQSIADLNADSSFVIRFRTIQPDESVKDWSVFGIWGVSGDIHFTVTRGFEHGGQMTPSDPEDASNYLAYKVLKLTGSEFEYQTVVTGNRFRSEKVADTFNFPE